MTWDWFIFCRAGFLPVRDVTSLRGAARALVDPSDTVVGRTIGTRRAQQLLAREQLRVSPSRRTRKRSSRPNRWDEGLVPAPAGLTSGLGGPAISAVGSVAPVPVLSGVSSGVSGATRHTLPRPRMDASTRHVGATLRFGFFTARDIIVLLAVSPHHRGFIRRYLPPTDGFPYSPHTDDAQWSTLIDDCASLLDDAPPDFFSLGSRDS